MSSGGLSKRCYKKFRGYRASDVAMVDNKGYVRPFIIRLVAFRTVELAVCH